MPIQFYHPNKSNTGTACSFSQSPKDGTIYATLIKQSSWDDTKKIGTFKDSRDNPEKHVNVKLGQVEVAAILDALDRGRAFSTVHDSDKSLKNINFQVWMSKPATPQEQPVPKGYSFTINYTNKEDSSQKYAFYIGLTFPESRLVREFLIYSLQKSFKEDYEINSSAGFQGQTEKEKTA